MYDVFISHKSDCKPWVRVLANNLKTQGFTIFLDEWELVPGKSIVEGLYQGLKDSAKGILVVTPEAIESGWVREEYNQMIIQKKEKPGFQVIPVVLGRDIPDFPFMKDILWIDFSDPAQYRETFYRLICAIQGKKPGPEIELEVEPVPFKHRAGERIQQDSGESSFLDELLESFYNVQALVLLAQEDRCQRGIKTYLLEKAKERFGNENVLHMVPLFSFDAKLEQCFSMLAEQCGFSPTIHNSIAMISTFEERLKGDQKLFLMVSGFENGSPELQQELSGVLRVLNERFPNKFKILVRGGEKLVDLYFSGNLSYLNQAEIREWPEMNVSDVLRIMANKNGYNKDAASNQYEAAKLLELSGGHPRVLDVCFDLPGDKGRFSLDRLNEALLNAPFLWRLFLPFMEKPEEMDKISGLLKEEDVGPAPPYIFDSFLKRLYWKNLLKRSTKNNRLVWRCKSLRWAGLQILANKKNRNILKKANNE